MLLKWEIETYFLSHLEKGKKTNTCLTRMCGEDGCSSFCCTCVHRRTEMAYEQHCAPDRLALETTVCPPQNCFWTRQLTIIHTFLHLKTSLLYLKGKKKNTKTMTLPTPSTTTTKKKTNKKAKPRDREIGTKQECKSKSSPNISKYYLYLLGKRCPNSLMAFIRATKFLKALHSVPLS